MFILKKKPPMYWGLLDCFIRASTIQFLLKNCEFTILILLQFVDPEGLEPSTP